MSIFLARHLDALNATQHLDTQPLDSSSAIDFPEKTLKRDIALAFGSALIQFLSSLSEPVIPWLLHPRCALVKDRDGVFEVGGNH
jgi:inositol polyphosphate 5-phosphatase INPP5B/F